MGDLISEIDITLFPWLNEPSKVNQTILGEIRNEPIKQHLFFHHIYP
jgi:hypothetical protein